MVNTICLCVAGPRILRKAHVLVDSTVFHAVSDRLEGPFKIQNSVGKGHNPEGVPVKGWPCRGLCD